VKVTGKQVFQRVFLLKTNSYKKRNVFRRESRYDRVEEVSEGLREFEIFSWFSLKWGNHSSYPSYLPNQNHSRGDYLSLAFIAIVAKT